MQLNEFHLDISSMIRSTYLTSRHGKMIQMWYLKIVLLVSIGIAITFTSVYAQNDVTSPLKQLKSGIMIQDVKCGGDRVLVIKESNEQPACVRPTSTARLLSNGWITLAKFETIHPIVQHNDTLVSQQQDVIMPNTNNTTGTRLVIPQEIATNANITNTFTTKNESKIPSDVSEKNDTVVDKICSIATNQ